MKKINNKLLKSIIITILMIIFIIAFIVLYFIIETNKSKSYISSYEYINNINKEKYMHFSMDDFILTFQDLTINVDKYDSIFDNETFSLLKFFNENYGTVFSLYCYYENEDFNLSLVPDKYKSEFIENSDWLKFGFHSYNANISYDDSSVDLIKQNYEKVILELKRIVGDKSITKVIRLHKYLGNISVVEYLKNNSDGITGLLGPDELNRKAYYLDMQKSNELYLSDTLIDNNINFYSTDIRVENIGNIYDLLNNISIDDKWIGKKEELICFTHEWQLYSIKSKYKIIYYMNKLFKYAIYNNYSFEYPN